MFHDVTKYLLLAFAVLFADLRSHNQLVPSVMSEYQEHNTVQK